MWASRAVPWGGLDAIHSCTASSALGALLSPTVLLRAGQSPLEPLRMHGRAEHPDRTAFGITGSRGFADRYLDIDLDVVAVAV